MCGRYELTTPFERLPILLKKNLPIGFESKYSEQVLIKPKDPVVVLKNEGNINTSLMLWGFISEWAKDPFDKEKPKPFNARAETVGVKKLFRSSWRHKRCLLPASGFLEKGHLIRRKDHQTFWLGGIWSRWISSEGSELESCCVLTTKSNDLVKPLHNRMPVIIPSGLEEQWIDSFANRSDLIELEKMMSSWNLEEWKAELFKKPLSNQMSLF